MVLAMIPITPSSSFLELGQHVYLTDSISEHFLGAFQR